MILTKAIIDIINEPGLEQLMKKIDFTKWTDAQLSTGVRFLIAGDPESEALMAELNKRRASGSNDGSEQRVAELIRSNHSSRRSRSATHF